jgi:hypothetical protein
LLLFALTVLTLPRTAAADGRFVARHGQREHVLSWSHLEAAGDEAPLLFVLEIWDLERRRLVRRHTRLGARDEGEPRPEDIGSSRVSLVTPSGIWCTVDGRFVPFPRDSTRAVRPDGRYVVSLLADGDVMNGTFRANTVEILDLAKGKARRVRLDTAMLSNGAPFSFEEPGRLVVTDYTVWEIDLRTATVRKRRPLGQSS